MPVRRGRPFLQTPGPTNIPERVLRAMHRPALDYGAPEFTAFATACLEDLKLIFQTRQAVGAFASSGHGAWEAALVNACAPGERILMPETGAFSLWWKEMAESLGIVVEAMPGDWRHGVDPLAVEARLAEDKGHAIRAVAMVHSDTASGVKSDCSAVRQAIDRARHPALLMVDVIASLAISDFRMDDWGVDVAVGASQKGLMLPPGMGFLAVSEKALAAARAERLPRNYWDWGRRFPDGQRYRFSGTAPEHLVFGLREAIDMLLEEGLERVFARHRRLGEAVRRSVAAWGADGGLEIFARAPAERADGVTAVLMPSGHDGEALRTTCRERFDVSLGGGLGKLEGRVFRIGHMGDLNEPMILGTLAAVEAALVVNGVPHRRGGIGAAIDHLAGEPRP